MTYKILVDTNIILDFLLQREPFFQEADLLFQAIDSGSVIGYVTATTLTDIFYIARRHTSNIKKAKEAITTTLMVMVICPVNRTVVESAVRLDMNDFEDAIQIACAINQQLDGIVTRDADFSRQFISILTIEEIFYINDRGDFEQCKLEIELRSKFPD